MISPEAFAQICAAREDASCSFLIRLVRAQESGVVPEAADRRARLDAQEARTEELRRLLKESLPAEMKVDLVPLSALGQVAATATASTWRSLAQPGSFLSQSQKLEILPNRTFSPSAG